MRSRGLQTGLRVVTVLTLVLVALTATAAAADFPTKPIRLIVPFAAGGSSDLAARALAPVLERYLGQPVVIINKPGANGTIATAEFKRERPDGYTILQNVVGNFTIQPFLRPVGYELEDFRGIIGLSYEPIIIGVNAKSPYQTLDDLIKDYKASGKPLSYGVSAIGALPHLSQAALFMKAGIEGRPIPYQGGGPAVTALVGGHVTTAAAHPPEIMPQVKAGAVRPLAVFSPERIPEAPDVPTAAELGYDVGEFAVWKFWLVPAKTPDHVVQILEDAFRKAYADPEFQERAKNLLLTVYAIDGETVMKQLREQQGTFEPVVEMLELRQ